MDQLNDYQLAKDIVKVLKLNKTKRVSPVSLANFRRYLTPLAKEANRKYVTKLEKEEVVVIRIL